VSYAAKVTTLKGVKSTIKIGTLINAKSLIGKRNKNISEPLEDEDE